MENLVRKISIGLVLALALLVGLSLWYYLPSTRMVELIGTEVKRFDANDNTRRTRDVRYIVARDYGSGRTLMFRNEDMGWPPHFKFNSGNLAGEVMNIKERQPDAIVLVSYYGWRIPFLSAYPNATRLKIVQYDHRHIPWFNLIFLASLFILAVYLYVMSKRWLRKRRDQKELY